MRVFQIWNNEVTVIDGDKTYIDSFDHFVDDGGRHDLPKKSFTTRIKNVALWMTDFALSQSRF